MTALRIVLPLLLLLAACGDPAAAPGGDDPQSPAGPAGGDADATGGDGGAVAEDAVWFERLAVSEHGGPFGDLRLVDTAEQLTALWGEREFEGTPPPIDFGQHVVLDISRADDGCADDLVEARMVDGELQLTWLPPPGPCTQPLLSWAHAVLLHRADLGEGFVVRIEGDGERAEHEVVLSPYDGPRAPTANPPPRQASDEEMAAVFADHPIRRCEEVVDPREPFFGRPVPSTPPPMDESVPIDVQTAWAAEHPDTFGWLMVDQSVGQWVVGVTRDADAHRAELEERHPGSRFEVVETPWTAVQLAAAQEAVADLHGGGVLRSSGAGAHLQVGLVDPTREDLDAIAERLDDPAIACAEVERSGLPRDG
jgi:hypothetical protein